jgi:hypothetical protein
MKAEPKPVRIEPAFADREHIRAMFEPYSPYRALAANGPMPACTTHVDNPSFYGATYLDYPRRFGFIAKSILEPFSARRDATKPLYLDYAQSSPVSWLIGDC